MDEADGVEVSPETEGEDGTGQEELHRTGQGTDTVRDDKLHHIWSGSVSGGISVTRYSVCTYVRMYVRILLHMYTLAALYLTISRHHVTVY